MLFKHAYISICKNLYLNAPVRSITTPSKKIVSLIKILLHVIIGQTFCDRPTILNLCYSFTMKFAQLGVISFYYIVTFKAFFDHPFCAIICKVKLKIFAWFFAWPTDFAEESVGHNMFAELQRTKMYPSFLKIVMLFLLFYLVSFLSLHQFPIFFFTCQEMSPTHVSQLCC